MTRYSLTAVLPCRGGCGTWVNSKRGIFCPACKPAHGCFGPIRTAKPKAVNA